MAQVPFDPLDGILEDIQVKEPVFDSSRANACYVEARYARRA